MFHRCWAEINLNALRENIQLIRQKVGRNVQVLFPVKADGYGHGLEQMAQTAAQCGVEWLGVANVDEAARVRQLLPDVSILILGLSFPEEAEEVVSQNVSSVVSSLDCLQSLNRAAEKNSTKARVHLKVDTGMGRIGVWHEEALDFLEKVSEYPRIELEGVLTHFPAAEKNDDLYTRVQIEHFKRLLKECGRRGISFRYVHLANSSGLIHYPESRESLVRPGIMVYGVLPTAESNGQSLKDRKDWQGIQPLLTLKSRILYIKEVQPGRTISYGRTYVVPRKTKIATIPIGYADGYPRSLSNKASVLIKERRLPVVGRVTMDQILVDLGPDSPAQEGDEVILIGRSADQSIRVEEVAGWAGTIPYEILTNLGDRIYREYH